MTGARLIFGVAPMTSRHTSRWFRVVILLGLGAVGCGGSATTVGSGGDEQSVTLTEVGELYRSFQLSKGKPPASVKDAATLERGNPGGMAAIKKGDVMVQWGAKLPDTGEEPGAVSAPEVLAYFKDAPEAGGSVLLLDRTIKKMTADEFKAAPKAGK